MSREIYRNEWKYLISWGEKELITSRIAPLLHPDPNAVNGGYLIRSLYFDDYWNTAYEQKESGVLERKKKYGAYIYKQSAKITRSEFEAILAGDYNFLLKSSQPLLQEFYVECRCHNLRPRTIVDYEREPWILNAGTVRITFDQNVRAAVGSFDIFDPSLPCLSVIDPGRLVMEVKFTEFLPKFVQDILPPQRAEMTAVSKYVLCYEKTQYLNGDGYWVGDGHDTPDIFRQSLQADTTERSLLRERQ